MKSFKQYISENIIIHSPGKTDDDVLHYNIVRKPVYGGEVVGKATTKKGARKSVDFHDNKYGAYAHRIVPVYKEEVMTESSYGMDSPLTIYGNEPKSDEPFKPSKFLHKDPHQFYQKHQTNLYILQHLSRIAGDQNKTNLKQHYENQIEKARTKRDWWITQKFTKKAIVPGSEEQKFATNQARQQAYQHLTDMGHKLEKPPTMEAPGKKLYKQDASGKKLFGV